MELIFQNPVTGATIVTFVTDAISNEVQNFTILQIKGANDDIPSDPVNSGNMEGAKKQAYQAGILLFEGSFYSLQDFKEVALTKGYNLIQISQNRNTGKPTKNNLVSIATLSSTVTSLDNFGETEVETQSASKTFKISGKDFTTASGNITVTAPANFVVSKTEDSGYENSVTFAYTEFKLALSDVFVKFAPTTTGAKTGNVAISGGGATTINVAVSGTGTSNE